MIKAIILDQEKWPSEFQSTEETYSMKYLIRYWNNIQRRLYKIPAIIWVGVATALVIIGPKLIGSDESGISTKIDRTIPATVAMHIKDVKHVDDTIVPGAGYEIHTMAITWRDDSKTVLDNLTPTTYSQVKHTFLDKLPSAEVQQKILPPKSPWQVYAQQSMTWIFLAMMLWMSRRQFSMLAGSSFDILKPQKNNSSMDDLLGMNDIKQEVKQIIQLLNNPDQQKSHGIEHPMNILFTGPAGTGKTRLAAIIAKELDMPMLHISASNLENGFLAGGSNTLKSLAAKARRMGRAVVFLDEGQSLFVKRGQSGVAGGKYADDTANTLLTLLDGVDRDASSHVIWIVATNFDDSTFQMDEAMSRRFGFKVNFRLPNREERKRILTSFFERRATHLSPDLNYDLLADVTAGLAPALLETIADKASMLSMQQNVPIDTNLAMSAFERTTVGLTNRETTAEQDETRRIVAVHELGHFFVQFEEGRRRFGNDLQAIGKDIPVLKISTESLAKGAGTALGFVLQKQQDSHLQTRTDLEWDVRKLYGGAASEEIFNGEENLTTGAYNDFQEATKLLKSMVWDMALYSRTKLSYTVLLGELPESNTQMVKEIEEASQRLYGETLNIIRSYTDIITTMAPYLLERYALTLDEAIQWIGAHEHLLPNDPSHREFVSERRVKDRRNSNRPAVPEVPLTSRIDLPGMSSAVSIGD
ncbi:AAA family ATPase [Thiobacillus denitrificans]|uniref:AAA family ATPase n=1 Tax=Thiobacillus denitrificans TaxID=36861 RepID=UPI0012F90C0C|nr:AAA family ATPase [Thiobacillus denitrificans]